MAPNEYAGSLGVRKIESIRRAVGVESVLLLTPSGQLTVLHAQFVWRRTEDMSIEDYRRFLSECIIRDPDKDSGLRDDELYGVYLSWCALKGKQPGSDHAFWNAIKKAGHAKNHADGQHVWPGITMTGPAAVDYILSSQPSLV